MAGRWTADLIRKTRTKNRECEQREYSPSPARHTCWTGTRDGAKSPSKTQLISKDTAESRIGGNRRRPLGFHFVALSRFPSTGRNWKIMKALAGKKNQVAAWERRGNSDQREVNACADALSSLEGWQHLAHNTCQACTQKCLNQNFTKTAADGETAALVDSLRAELRTWLVCVQVL